MEQATRRARIAHLAQELDFAQHNAGRRLGADEIAQVIVRHFDNMGLEIGDETPIDASGLLREASGEGGVGSAYGIHFGEVD